MSPIDLAPLLKQTFGYDTFRPLQREIMDATLAGRDVVAILPTGAGKSLCFQLPALAREGLTLVISPLIALMKEIADAPVPQKGVTFDNIKPLTKSDDAQPLSKAEVANKLFELKKSGTKVDSNDITQAELGNESTLSKLVEKYGIK